MDFGRSMRTWALGEVSLPNELAGKHMEDMLVHDGVAYIVDNVIMPMFLFRVDVSDPVAPSYLEVLQMWGTNQSLHQQWLTPDANRWQFLQTTGHRGGGEQRVIVTPMADAAAHDVVEIDDGDIEYRADHELNTTQIHQWARDSAPDPVANDGDHGFRIEDVASTPPVYAAVDDGDDDHLATVDRSDGDVSFDLKTTLDASARVDTVAATAVALSDNGTLSLFDTRAETLRHEQAVDVEYPLELAVLDA